MKTNPKIKTTFFTALCLIATCAVSLSAEFTWNGGGGNGNWSTGANWVGGIAPTGGSNILNFSGTQQLSSVNNGQLASGSLNFLAGAGAFTLTGTALSLSGDVVNYSTSTQTINNNFTLLATRTFDTRSGDIVYGGVINHGTNSNRGIAKTGQATLKLTGSNTYQGPTFVYQGTVLLDALTGGIGSSSSIRHGDSGNRELGNNATFAVTGTDYTYSNAILMYNEAANTIRADGIELTFGSFGNAIAQGTTNFDLSAAGSSIAFTTAPSTFAGRIVQATVTAATGTTSFATVSGSNTIIALTGLTDLSTNPFTDGNTNASLNGGTYTNNQADRNLNSLTLSGALGGTVSGTNVRPREVLMQEGTGDYTFNVRVDPSVSTYDLYLHQYSTVGTLIVTIQVV